MRCFSLYTYTLIPLSLPARIYISVFAVCFLGAFLSVCVCGGGVGGGERGIEPVIFTLWCCVSFQDPEGAGRDHLGPTAKLQVGAC